MTDLSNILVSKPLGIGSEINHIPNHFGVYKPCVYARINKKSYALGGITEKAKVLKFSDGWVVYEQDKGTAFVFLENGSIYIHDLEDERVIVFNGSLIFHSDAGLSLFSESGETTCVFNEFNQYFLDINLSEINKGIVTFTRGDSSIMLLSISDIASQIGKPSFTDLFNE